MPGATKNFIGLEGFIWWIGVVEDRQDPEQLGRVRVRCFGWHTEDKSKIPTDALPWAHPVLPVNSPNVYTPKEGDMVFGFFVDGTNAQNPAIVGVLPGKPEAKPKYQNGFSDPGNTLSSRPKKPDDDSDKYPKTKYLKESTLNRLSRGKSDATIIATRKKNLKKNVKSAGGVVWSEPPPSFAPKYPYNNALETESGHALEFDDTPGKERVHLAHRKGAYMEFDKDGSKIERVQKDNYCVIMGDDFIYVKGKASITVEGNFNLKTSKINIEASEINMAADGAVKIKGSSVKIESTGTMDLKAAKAGKFTAGGRLDLKGATAGLGGATVDIPAAKVNLQGGSVSSASGTGLKGGGTTPSQQEINQVAQESSTATPVAKTDAVSASQDKLEEVKITSKKVQGNTAASVFGKQIKGITSTVSKSLEILGSTADGINLDFINKTPLGEIIGKVYGFADALNSAKATILDLALGSKRNLYAKVDNVSLLSYNNGIDFRLDASLQNDMLDTLYNLDEAKVDNVMGKHVYPKTETVQVENDAFIAEYSEVLERYASQTLDPELQELLYTIDQVEPKQGQGEV